MSESRTLDALETSNLDLVTEFCRAWEFRDVEKLIPYLGEEIDYHIWEGGAEIHGIQECYRPVSGRDDTGRVGHPALACNGRYGRQRTP